MKRISLALCILLSIAMLAGCGGNESASGTGKPSASVPAAAPDNPFLGYWYDEGDDENCLVFYEDGRAETLYMGELEMEGKYKLNGEKATLTMDDENYQVSVEGSILTVADPEDPDETFKMKRGTAPKAPVNTEDIEDSVKYDILSDNWYLNGDLSNGYLMMDAAGNFWAYDDGMETSNGTYIFDGTTLSLTLSSGESADLLLSDENTIYFEEEGNTYVRESACSGDPEELSFEPVAEVGDWIDMQFYNDSEYIFTEVYLYEDDSDTGYNHIESISSLGPGESCGIGVDRYDFTKVSLVDEDGDEWYFSLIEFDEGAYVTISLDAGDPLLEIEYSNGYTVQETGTIY